jgi:hypothetical protein
VYDFGVKRFKAASAYASGSWYRPSPVEKDRDVLPFACMPICVPTTRQLVRRMFLDYKFWSPFPASAYASRSYMVKSGEEGSQSAHNLTKVRSCTLSKCHHVRPERPWIQRATIPSTEKYGHASLLEHAVTLTGQE